MQIEQLKTILGSAPPNKRPTVRQFVEHLLYKAHEVHRLFAPERDRVITRVGDLVYIAYYGVPASRLEAFSAAVSERAIGMEGIVDTHVNPYVRRVVARVNEGAPTDAELALLVSSAEQAVGTMTLDRPSHLDRVLPDDPQRRLEYIVEATVDTMALLSGLALSLMPVVPRAVGGNLYSALFIISVVPELRHALDRRFGKVRTDLMLHIGFAASLGLARRPLSSLVKLMDTLENLRELKARTALWERLAPELTRGFQPIDLKAIPAPRPVPIPKGPIERYEQRAKLVAACAFGFALFATRNPLRAIPAAFAALPHPAHSGRDLFTAELGRILARRGMLVLSPEALHRLDRIDCLVIPADLVSREQFQIIDAFALKGLSRDEALAEGMKLFHPEHPLRVYSEGGLAIGPVRALSPVLDGDVEIEMTARARRGALILGLMVEDRISALLEVHITSKSSAAEAIRKAHRAGMKLVLAADDPEVASGLDDPKYDAIIGLHHGLAEGIRALQKEGRTVCFLGRGPAEGFGASDLGVAIRAGDAPISWSAHILCPESNRLVDTILDACQVARVVSRQSAGLALIGASMGTLASTSGDMLSVSGRVISVMSGVTLAAMLNGAQRSMAIWRKPRALRDPTPWQALEAEGVMAKLGAGPAGLSSPPASRKERGINLKSLVDLSNAVRLEVSNPLTPLLAVGAAVSAVVGSKADAGIVAGVGLINGVIGGVQRFRTERAITALVKTAEARARVVRGHQEQICPAGELRKGDIVRLAGGEVVPADCRIIEADSLVVDTSPLTGESQPVRKGPAPCFAENVADITSMLYAGNIIAAGNATAVVVATGEETVMARASLLSVTDEARGGVEARLRELMMLTGPVTLVAGVALVVSGILRGRRVEDLVSTGVGLAVAAVPEGLPLLATAAQLSAAERLSRRGALVKNPRAIEALGRVDLLCMDKTGTITEGRIELTTVHAGRGMEPLDRLGEAGRAVLRAAARAVVREKGATMDPMDTAIDRAMGGHLDDETALDPLAVRPFDSSLGFEAVLGRLAGDAWMFVKGAPELIIEQSVNAVVDGETLDLARATGRLHENIESLTSQGLRVIAVGVRRMAESELLSAEPATLLDRPKGLTFLGLIAFRDPVRHTAAAAVTNLSRAGVRVVMLTGDHPGTAERVASEVGLLGVGEVLRGTEIAEMTDEALDAAMARTSVFARVGPGQKVRVIRSLQRLGHIVGMVGDGANDAAAMRAADAGIAVGLRSTEAARAAADIVLKEGRIDELFEAVVEGRAMWRSVRNAVSILVGGNLGEIAFSVAVGALTGRPPLNPRQLLLVNFLTDIAPSTAIAIRPPSIKDLTALRHVGPKEALGSPMNREIVTRAITTSIGSWSAWSLARVTGGRERASTVGLLGLVGSQLGQTLLTGGRSRSVVLTGVGSFLALGILVQTPGLSSAMGCRPIGPLGWSTAITASLGSTLISPVVEAAVNRAADRWHDSVGASRASRATRGVLRLAKSLLVI